jgi:hypothetical protein
MSYKIARRRFYGRAAKEANAALGHSLEHL